MACKQSGLSDSVPILVFGQAAAPTQGPQTAVMGYCAGHHLAGAFNYTISTSIGHGSLLPNIDQRYASQKFNFCTSYQNYLIVEENKRL